MEWGLGSSPSLAMEIYVRRWYIIPEIPFTLLGLIVTVRPLHLSARLAVCY